MAWYKIILKNIYFQSLLFWVCSFIVLHRLFTIDYDNGWADALFTILFHLPLMVIVYLNYYFIQKFIPGKFYARYAISFLGLIMLGWMLYSFGFEAITDLIAPTYYFTLFYSGGELIQFIVSYLAISFLLVLTRNWFLIKDQQVALETENYRANLNLLKAQLNPHFLFNSLNNIYSLSKDNPMARDYLMKLGDSLRYMTYETNEDLVLLENEIHYLDNYLSLEKLRLENPEGINFTVNGNIEGYLIAPLIFHPLVENSLKYADRKNPMIDIEINIDNDILTFTSINNIGEGINSTGGLGIENVKKRLELIYNGKYDLDINDHGNQFVVSLHINLNPDAI